MTLSLCFFVILCCNILLNPNFGFKIACCILPFNLFPLFPENSKQDNHKWFIPQNRSFLVLLSGTSFTLLRFLGIFFAQKRSILINLPALLELNLEFYILYTILNNSFLSNFSCEFEFSNAIFWFNVARYVYIQIAKGSLSNRVFIHPPCKYWRIGVAF